MNGATQPTQTAWACVMLSLSQPVQSQYGGTERYTTVDVNGQQAKIYIKCGTPLEQLAPGDRVVVEWRSGKWRIAKTQPPELMQTLATRAPLSPPAPMPTMPTASAPIPTASAPIPMASAPSQAPTRPERWSGEHKRTIADEVSNRTNLLKFCHNQIADQFTNAKGELLISEEAVQKYACTLYLDIKNML